MSPIRHMELPAVNELTNLRPSKIDLQFIIKAFFIKSMQMGGHFSLFITETKLSEVTQKFENQSKIGVKLSQ